MHYFKRNIGDYHKKAGRLSMLQHGAYTLLIDACYDREIFPTIEEAIDWCWASSNDEIEAVEFVLKKFFFEEEGVFVQQRIQDEVDNYHKNSATNKQIALKREAKRREKSTKRARKVNEAPPNYELLTNNQELITINQSNTEQSNKSDNRSKEIFEFWCETMSKNRSAFSPKRKKVIEARLKDGYPIDEIKTAIINCSNTPHNMGRNENNKEYNDIELICRSSEKLEQFRDNAGVTNESHQQSNQSYADTVHEQARHAIQAMESGDGEVSDGNFLDDF